MLLEFGADEYRQSNSHSLHIPYSFGRALA